MPKMSFDSGSGSGSIAGAADAAMNNPANGDVLSYDATTSKWRNDPAILSRLDSLEARIAELEYASQSDPPTDPDPAPTPTVTTHSFVYSVTPDRAAPVVLEGATVSGNIYAQVLPTDDVTSVDFFIGTDTSGTPARTEKTAPFDFAGGSGSDALPFDTTTLANGAQSFTARITRVDTTIETITAAMTVDNATAGPTPPPDSPPLEAKPTELNTGVTVGTTLTASSGQSVSTDNTIIENLDITGGISVSANYVTIRNCKITYSGTGHAVNVAAGYNHLTVEDCEINLASPADAPANSAIMGRDYVTVQRCNIYGHGDGIKLWNYGLYENNYIHMMKPPGSTKHLDGMQCSGKTEWTVRNNNIDMPIANGGNSAIFCQAYTGTVDQPVENCLIENNWLNGGNYTMFMEDGKKVVGGWIRNCRILTNRFGRDYRYGSTHLEGDVVFTGNVYDDDDSPV